VASRDRRPAPTISQLLFRWGDGDQAALDALMPLVYDELRRHAPLKSCARVGPLPD
jgi:hypothetical protein